MTSIAQDARAVFQPAIADLQLTDALRQFLDRGGRSILLGETRDEYVARRVSAERYRLASFRLRHEI